MSITLAVVADPTAQMSLTAVMFGVVLLGANGFFVAIEIALLAVRRTRIEELADAGDRRAVRALRALRELSVTFSGAQLGITMCSLGLGLIAEPALAVAFARMFALTSVPAGVIPVVAVVVALSLTVFLHMVIGEMAPKNVAIARADTVTLALITPFAWFVAAFRPLIWVLNALANRLVRLVRVTPVDEHALIHTADELAYVVAEANNLGRIDEQDARVIDAALRLGSMDAQAAMTPRVDMVAVAQHLTVADVLEAAAVSGHSRIPVFADDIDHVVGVVHVKDLLVGDDVAITDTARQVMRPLLAVPESLALDRLLAAMRRQRSHAAVVVDEFGGTAGLITLEDILEELVGEIADEFDDATVMRATDSTWVLPGSFRRDEVQRSVGVELHGDAETLSGWLVEQLGRFPATGDQVVNDEGYVFTIMQADRRRAVEVEIHAPETARSTLSSTDEHA
ncbi:MAG: hemolysin family protein [Nitriliruptoraceae bacterium]